MESLGYPSPFPVLPQHPKLGEKENQERLSHTWAMDWGCFGSYLSHWREKLGMGKLGSVVVAEGWEGQEKQNPAELLCQKTQMTLLRFLLLDYLTKLHSYKRHLIVQLVPGAWGTHPCPWMDTARGGVAAGDTLSQPELAQRLLLTFDTATKGLKAANPV